MKNTRQYNNLYQFVQNGIIFFLLLTSVQFYGCIGAGTHGSIKGYQYPVPKAELQKAVEIVIGAGGNIHRDTLVNYIVDQTGGKRDTLIDNQYNDGENYTTIYISKGDVSNEYTFRYYGDKEYWDTAKTSEIFIAYAYDKDGKGGSEGHGDITWYTPLLKKRLVSVFENEFISKLDSVVGKKHIEGSVSNR